MIPDELCARVRHILESEPNATAAYLKLEDSPQGELLILALAAGGHAEDSGLLARVRVRIDEAWSGPVDVVPLTETTPPIYFRLVRESFQRILGDETAEGNEGFAEVVRRRSAWDTTLSPE
jgi:hypothetical protein